MKYASFLDSTKNALLIMGTNPAKFILHSQDKDVPTPEGNCMCVLLHPAWSLCQSPNNCPVVISTNVNVLLFVCFIGCVISLK